MRLVDTNKTEFSHLRDVSTSLGRCSGIVGRMTNLTTAVGLDAAADIDGVLTYRVCAMSVVAFKKCRG